MTSPALLKTYRCVRDVVGDIHQSATAVDEHLGRFQVYSDDEQMAFAMAEAERLSVHLKRLKRELRRCIAASIVGDEPLATIARPKTTDSPPNVQVAA
jgi:hypothetical protein